MTETEESHLSVSEDEETESQDKVNSMELDGETQDEDEDTTNKENENKSSNSKKRKNSSPDADTDPPKKKRKIDDKSIQTLLLKIGADENEYNVKVLQKIPYFKSKMIKDKNTGGFKFKGSRDNRFSSSQQKWTSDDFNNMIKYMNDKDLDHIENVDQLESIIYCAEKFEVKLDFKAIEVVYFDDEVEDDEKLYKQWKNSKSKLLQKLYKKIQNEQQEEKDEEMSDKKETKNKRRPPKQKKKDNDGDITMTKEEKEAKKKEKAEKRRERNKKMLKKLKASVPEYLQLSDDDNEDSDNKNKNIKNKNIKKKKHEKSHRLKKQQRALMTQEPIVDNDNDMMSESEEDENKREKNKNEDEKYIKNLNQVNMEEIESLQSMTIHRLCRTHKIEIHKTLTKKQKQEKEELETSNKENKTHKRWKYDFVEQKKLIKKLKTEKKIMDKEINIKTLDDVDERDDIGEFRRDTIVRLCKRHRIAANQKLIILVETLEDRFDNPSDDDDYIETLKDIKHIDDIQHLSREVLIRLCNKHNIVTVKKKKKKKKKKGDSDSDSDCDDDDTIDLGNKELITSLEEIKKRTNEQKCKKQQNQMKKLEAIQQNMLNIGFRENYLTISGSDTFKEKVGNLIAVCNSEATNKPSCYDVVDDELDQYKVCISENGARTIKCMMTIARGGSVVPDKWVSHSIKGKRWIDPQNYEKEWDNWQTAAIKSRESSVSKRKRKAKKDKDGDDNMVDESSDDDLDAINGPLLKDYTIYIQDRPNIKPSANALKHLAWNAGAQIVNENWKYEALKKKEEEKSPPKKNKRSNRNRRDDDNEDEDGDDENSDDDNTQSDGNDQEEVDDNVSDDDSDNDNKNKRKKRDKKRKSKRKGRGKGKDKKGNKKKQKITAARSRKSIKGDDDGDDYSPKRKRVTKLRDNKLIISHPAIYKHLKRKKKNDVDIVGQNWLFESIENFKVEDVDDHIVTPNKNQSRSPAH